MSGRGQPKVMYEGLLIATPSGVGVSIGLLNSDMCPLVGVAISASLLPPAVNTGMLLAYSLAGKYDSDKYEKEDLWEMAGISLSLTLENIMVIWIVAMTVFKLKSAVPRVTSNNSSFWAAAAQKDPVEAHKPYTPGANRKAKFQSVLDGLKFPKLR